jgi:putative Mn2+ efflux pump MntP
MSFFVLVGIAVGLAMDAFAVAVACSMTMGKVTGRQIYRFAFHFGLFQAMMPVWGWLAGRTIAQYIEAYDHWVALGLLGFVGGKAIWNALWGKERQLGERDPTRGVSLVVFSVATSIDALAVGLSLAMLSVDIWYPALVIGVVTATLTTVGMLIGSRVGARFSKRVEAIGGLILIGIGLKILFSHLFG